MCEANIPQVDKLEQACEGNVNEDHHFRITISEVRLKINVERAIKASEMALFLTELVDSFIFYTT